MGQLHLLAFRTFGRSIPGALKAPTFIKSIRRKPRINFMNICGSSDLENVAEVSANAVKLTAGST
jgi:hypothetical protein